MFAVRPQIHVIQIGSSLYDVLQISSNQNIYCCDCPEYNSSYIENECHQNNNFSLENIGVFSNPVTSSVSSTPPPSYDEVMLRNPELHNQHIKIDNQSRDIVELPKIQRLSAARDRHTITTPPNFTNQN